MHLVRQQRLQLALGPQEELAHAGHAQAGFDRAQQVFLLLPAEDDDRFQRRAQAAPDQSTRAFQATKR
jgi:hypothetical protein